MKVEIESEDIGFRPIQISLTIESEEELCSLWHRTNIATAVFSKPDCYASLTLLPHGVSPDYVLWNKLNKLVNQRGLFKR